MRLRETVEELQKTVRNLRAHVRVLETVQRQVMKGNPIPFKLRDFYILKNGKLCGDLFTVDNFREMVESGAVIDYDGNGRFATAEKESDIEVSPSTFHLLFMMVDDSLTHVIWFNK